MQYAKIQESKESPFKGNIYNYLTVDGYTKRSGAPTGYMVRLEGSLRWHRVMNFCNSNSGTLFVKTKNNSFLVVRLEDISKV